MHTGPHSYCPQHRDRLERSNELQPDVPSIYISDQLEKISQRLERMTKLIKEIDSLLDKKKKKRR